MNKEVKFNLFGDEWKLVFVDSLEEDAFGNTNAVNRTISIALKDHQGDSFSDVIVKQTVAHELFHAILFSGQYMNASDDEPLVEWLGRCIYALKQQQVFNLL